jgi:hypothetical protein
MQMLRKNDCASKHLSTIQQNYKHTYKILHPWIYRIKSGTCGHMGVSKPYQKSHVNELLNTPDHEMIHPPYLDYIKGEPPNTGYTAPNKLSLDYPVPCITGSTELIGK